MGLGSMCDGEFSRRNFLPGLMSAVRKLLLGVVVFK